MDILKVMFWIMILVMLNVLLVTSGFVWHVYFPEFRVIIWFGITALVVIAGIVCGYACARELNR